MLKKALDLFASRKTAIALFIAALAGSLLKAHSGWGGNYPLIAILALLSINLITCLSINAKRIWRRSIPLFIFHVGLIGLSLSSLYSGLTYFHAYFQLAEGQSGGRNFQSPLKGPFYKDQLDGFGLTLVSSKIEFFKNDLGVAVDDQQLLVARPGKAEESDVLRFNEPILYGAYRFYLAMDQGFALVFNYTGKSGRNDAGVVFLPPYPADRERQVTVFGIPGTETGQLSASVDLKSAPYDPKRAWRMTAPENARVDLAFSADGRRQRVSLRAGDKVKIAGGTLQFEELRRWHGFLVDYDPSRPFLAASTLVAFLGLTWFYSAKVLGRGRGGAAKGPAQRQRTIEREDGRPALPRPRRVPAAVRAPTEPPRTAAGDNLGPATPSRQRRA